MSHCTSLRSHQACMSATYKGEMICLFSKCLVSVLL